MLGVPLPPPRKQDLPEVQDADVCKTPPRSAVKPASKPPPLAGGGGGGGGVDSDDDEDDDDWHRAGKAWGDWADGNDDDPDSPCTAWQKAQWSPWRSRRAGNSDQITSHRTRKRSGLSLPAAAAEAEGGAWEVSGRARGPEELGGSAEASFISRQAESSAAAPAAAEGARAGMAILGRLMGGADAP